MQNRYRRYSVDRVNLVETIEDTRWPHTPPETVSGGTRPCTPCSADSLPSVKVHTSVPRRERWRD